MEAIKNNEIIYTSVDGKKIYRFDNTSKFGDGLHLVEHTYENGVGKVVYDGEVTQIGREILSWCDSLSSINIPNSVTSIGHGAFRMCSSLRSINIPNSVTRIGDFAFGSCESLSSIVIPNSVKSIGYWVFNNCMLLDNKLANSDRCFKAFNADMTCRDFQYEEGKSYHCDNIKLCKSGFHYCTSILELFNYYSGEDGKDIVIHEVFHSGEIIKEENSTKHCCSDIKIGRRIPFSEIGELVREMLK